MNTIRETCRPVAALVTILAALSCTLRAAAPNDAFMEALDLGAVSEWSVVVDTAAATIQVGEPAHPGWFPTFGSLWWTWTAPPGDGELEFKPPGGGVMHLYQGDRLDELTRIDAVGGNPSNRRAVTGGQTYRVMLGANHAATSVGFLLHPKPANDDFADATDLGSAFPRTVTAANDAATRQSGEPEHGSPGESGSLWWKWTAPVDGVVKLDFPGAPSSGWVLAAYRAGDLETLVRAGRAFSSSTQAAVFRASAGETVFFALATGSASQRGSASFRIDMRELPNNNTPETALDLGTTASAIFTGDTTAATPDPPGFRAPAIWWRWSPPVNGRVNLRILQPGPADNLDLFRIGADGSQEKLPIHYPYCRADEVYLIRLQRKQTSPVEISLSLDPAPPNDDLAGALPLPFVPTPYDLSLAGSEPGESLHWSIWWHFTPPVDGALIADGRLFAAGALPVASPADLVPVPPGTNATKHHLVSAGENYHLANHAPWYQSRPITGILDALFIPRTTGNALFANAASLGDSSHGRVHADMAEAVSEPDEPIPDGGSLWWSWTAPFNGTLMVELKCWECQFSYSVYRVSLFSGESLGSLAAVAPPSSWTNFESIRAFNVVAGTTYHLRINRNAGPFDFRYDAFPIPHANQLFANPVDLGSTTFHEETVIFLGASKESGEPTHDPAFTPATASRWWRWTAPADMTVDISGPVAAAYLGDSLATLQPIGINLNLPTGPVHRFAAEAGRTYRIALVGRNNRPTFRLVAHPSPPGDRFHDPEDLGDVARVSLSKVIAEHTREPGEPGSLRQGGVTHWWKWTPPKDGTVSLSDSIFNGIWSFVLGDDPATATVLPVRDPVTVSAGEPLRIRLHLQLMASYSRILQFRPFEPNDDFAGATDLGSVTSASIAFDAHHATSEPDEPATPIGISVTRSLWWTWTAPADGRLAFSGVGESTLSNARVIDVFEGDALDALTRIRTTFEQPRDFSVLEGRTYRIRFASTDHVNAFAFDLQFSHELSNDHWERAIDLGNATSAAGVGSLLGKTPEWFSPDTSRAGTAWWKWTAPDDGTAFIHVSPARDVRVFADPASGVALPTASIHANLASPGHALPVALGETIWISVGAMSTPKPPAIDIRIHHLTRPENSGPDHAAPLAVGSVVEASFVGTSSASGDELALWWEWMPATTGAHILRAGSASLRVFAADDDGEWTQLEPQTPDQHAWNAVAGTRYRIALVAPPVSWPHATLALETLDPVANDAFPDAIRLTGDSAHITSHLINATAEPGELAHGGIPAARSLWYRWTAPETQRLSLKLGASRARIAVYTGDAIASLVAVAAHGAHLDLPVDQGVTYQIAVDGEVEESFTLTLRSYEPPANDRLVNRTILTSDAPEFAGRLEFATTEPGEPAASKGSLWWQWTPPWSNREIRQFRVDAPANSSVKLMLHIPQVAPGHPQFFNSVQEMFPGSVHSFQGGLARYLHLRATTDSPPSEPVVFRLVPVYGPVNQAPVLARPPNDDFADAIHLGDAWQVRSSAVAFAGITNEDGEPDALSFYRALWWSWTAPTSGYRHVVRTTRVSRIARVYTGSSVATLTPVPLNSGGGIFFAEAGVTYHFQILTNEWGRNFPARTRDDTTLGFEIADPPAAAPNDRFAQPINLGSAVDKFMPSNNVGAAAEPGEPAHGGVPASRSVWFLWTAPATGDHIVDAAGAVMRAAVYLGNDLSDLTEVASGVELLTFSATAGTTYRIALDSDLPEIFRIQIASAPLPPDPGPPANDHFAAAHPLHGGPHTVAGSLRGSTVEPDEPLAASSHKHSAWWAWTAAASGPVTISTTNNNVTLAAYTGSSPANLRPAAPPSSTLRFHATAGVTYPIAVSAVSHGQDFSITFDSTIAAPPHDRFTDALELTGPIASASLATAGASQEPGQPTSSHGAILRPVWAVWTAPSDGMFDVTVSSATTTQQRLEIFTGDSLDQLTSLAIATSFHRLAAIGGTRYVFAINIPSTRQDIIDLHIQPTDRPPNDDFADRIHLGTALDARIEGTTANATQEPGEPLASSSRTATVWWSWTAPASGTYALELETNQISTLIITGTPHGDFTTIKSSFNDTVSSFEAQAGETYQIALSTTPANGREFAFFIHGNPPPNDDFENRIVLPSQLPLHVTGSVVMATLQPGEPRFAGNPTGRTVWWEWTAPADGMVDLIGPSGTVPSAHVLVGNMLSFLRAIPVTRPANGVQRFHAMAGTPYIIAYSAGTSTFQANAPRLELRAARPTAPNDLFANAIPLVGESTTSTSHNWGAATEPGEPPGDNRSLWWTWTAPRNGSARVTASHGTVRLYQGNAPNALVPVENPFSDVNFYPVMAGETFHLSVNTNANPLDVTITLEMTPPGDDFHAPIPLPSIMPAAVTVDLTTMGWEPLEPPHRQYAAEQSAWLQWTAPDATPVALTLDSAFAARVQVYTGHALTALTPVADGIGGVEFIPVRGETYHIAIDVARGAAAGPVTIRLTQPLTGYAAWRAARFPDPNAPDADPHADPDGDGRTNLMEMALGTNPLAPDAAPGKLRIRDVAGHVTLSIDRPVGVDGIRYSFEVAPALGEPWLDAKSMAHLEWATPLEDGMEIYHTLLIPMKTKDHPTFFARLRVEPADQ